MRRVLMGVVVAALFALACGRSASVPSTLPPPAPEAAPPTASDPVPSTIEQAVAARETGHPELFEAAMRDLSQSADPLIRRRALALEGLYQYDQKRYSEAVSTLGAAVTAWPEIAPFLELRMADAQRMTGGVAEAIATANDIVLRAPTTGAAISARIELPALYATARQDDAATSAAALLSDIAIDELTEAEFVKMADDVATAGNAPLATAIRLRILTTYPQGRTTETLYGQVAAADPSPLSTMTFEEETSLAGKLARFNRYDQALDLLRRIEARFPGQTDSAAYRLLRARALFNSRNYRELTSDLQLNDGTSAMQLMRARAFWRIERPADFLAGMQSILARWPRSSEAVEARLLLSKYYVTDDPNYPQSISYLEQAIAAGATGDDGETIWTLGWINMLAGRYDEALRIFDRYINTYPDGDYKTNSLFWSGRVLARLNRQPEAEARWSQLQLEYPYNYYSYRARALTSHQPPPAEVANGYVFPDVEKELAALADPRLVAVHDLDSLGLVRDAVRETKRIAADNPNNHGLAYFLADLYLRAGEEGRAYGVLGRSFRDFLRHGGSGIPTHFWEIAFPLHYWEIIEPAAKARGLDPFLVASIIRQESAFEESDVSNAGAVGLMQIMPREAERIAAAGGLPTPTRDMLFDPKTNIEIGIAEFTQKLALENGSQVLAIAAYNAGEDAVGRWLARTPLDDLDLFVDSIPFSDTRLYVKTVTRSQEEYRRIYEERTRSTGHP